MGTNAPEELLKILTDPTIAAKEADRAIYESKLITNATHGLSVLSDYFVSTNGTYTSAFNTQIDVLSIPFNNSWKISQLFDNDSITDLFKDASGNVLEFTDGTIPRSMLYPTYSSYNSAFSQLFVNTNSSTLVFKPEVNEYQIRSVINYNSDLEDLLVHYNTKVSEADINSLPGYSVNAETKAYFKKALQAKAPFDKAKIEFSISNELNWMVTNQIIEQKDGTYYLKEGIDRNSITFKIKNLNHNDSINDAVGNYLCELMDGEEKLTFRYDFKEYYDKVNDVSNKSEKIDTLKEEYDKSIVSNIKASDNTPLNYYYRNDAKVTDEGDSVGNPYNTSWAAHMTSSIRGMIIKSMNDTWMENWFINKNQQKKYERDMEQWETEKDEHEQANYAQLKAEREENFKQQADKKVIQEGINRRKQEEQEAAQQAAEDEARNDAAFAQAQAKKKK